MKFLRGWVFYTLLYICATASAEPTDSMEVSLLTCAPGTEVYSLYGHTAIRMKSYATGMDWVFNYGVFSFNKPHFIWRFTKGECDYRIGALPFKDFLEEYEERGSAVYQQMLNLTKGEKMRLWALLSENMRPENREYRYNFLYDNCTTRARDRIEQAVDGVVLYPESDTVRTFRTIIHQYTADYPWAELGNDICLGAEADRPITEREEMFAPFCLMHYAQDAVIQDRNGRVRPLVSSCTTVIEGRPMAKGEEGFPLTPRALAWTLFVVVAALTIVEYVRGACYWWMDIVLMTVTGLLGLVVTFLFFFSEHPTVGSNWQIWVFNPIPLLAAPWVAWCGARRRKTLYHMLNAAVLILFMIFSALIPQDFCVVVVPLASVLLLRSCAFLAGYRKQGI